MAAYSAANCCLVFLASTAVRLIFMYSPAREWFRDRIELSTPLTDWKRVEEGLSLLSHGVSPYSGDVVHESPLVLLLFHAVRSLSGSLIPLMFVVLDLVTGLLIYKLSRRILNSELSDQKARQETFAKNADVIFLKGEALSEVPLLTAAVYLLSPYAIGSCVAQSTVIFTNFSIVLSIYTAMRGNAALASFGVAMATYQSLYPMVLLSPVTLLVIKSKPDCRKWQGCMKIVLLFILWLGGLLSLSYQLFNSLDFMKATYGFILSVPDLTPNIGLFWYFFTEMFEHFRPFFLWVFQLNAFFYCLPLTIKLRQNPGFLACMLVSVIAIMKSYPAFGDAGLSMALLVIWKHTFPYMRNAFLITCLLLFATFLAPIFWYLWIYAGSANANFFFAITLVYSTAQILLSSDVLFAYLRREYDLVSGIYPKVMDGEPANVVFN
ncbi:phosphatidylinositol glycan anchor biosynthesis class U protein [Nematostella vectensis]|uniref:phosphatidylinositol glycan anchor biosynthesis class U protein n=1 Tax=Nematostella vectensis TaxID=45351 RepID=UPI00138FCB9B|nr:phosphatidylinositol glycan anchor biosynthesis class U protein [Nematostella vectensis]